MALSKPKFPSQLFSERFDLKLFLSLDLIRELVALQHRQTTGEVERMGDFAPDCREQLKLPTNQALPTCTSLGKPGDLGRPNTSQTRWYVTSA